jgi:plastocyanin
VATLRADAARLDHVGRRCLIAVAALAAGLVVPAAASAATVNVASGQPSNAYTPKDVTITHGDTVTWNNFSGTHNVHFDNGSFDQPPNAISGAWTVSKTFTTTGTYRYYCELHGGPNGVGMAGTVTVKPPYQAPQSASPVNLSLVPVFKQTGTPANPTNA